MGLVTKLRPLSIQEASKGMETLEHIYGYLLRLDLGMDVNLGPAYQTIINSYHLVRQDLELATLNAQAMYESYERSLYS